MTGPGAAGVTAAPDLPPRPPAGAGPRAAAGAPAAADTAGAADRRHGAGRPLALLLTAGGTIGWLASFQLSVEHDRVLRDAGYVPACSVNDVIGCGGALESWQGSLFGFPNMPLGLTGFAVVAALGAAALGGARLHRLVWLALAGGLLAAVGFTHWLIHQSLYVLGTLCPYCVVIWLVTVALFWYVARHVLARGMVPVPRRLRAAGPVLREFSAAAVATWYGVIALLIVTRFPPPW